MKKLFVAALLVLSIICLVACNAQKNDASPTLEDNVSLCHEYLLLGSGETYAVQIEMGKREKLLVADGKVGDVVQFTEISVKNLSGSLDGIYTFEIATGNSTINGTLSKNVFGNCLTSTAELSEHAGEINAITIVCGETREEITLTNAISGSIDWHAALAVAEKEFAERIAESAVDGVCSREIYVKLVSDGVSQDSPHFWYVAFLANDDTPWAVLVDPASGDVISKR